MTQAESNSQGAAGLGFAAKVILTMLGLVLGLQAANLLSARYAVSTAVSDQLHRELEVGRRVWEESHAVRLRQLADRVLVLAEDFGFRQAVATGDRPTVESALANAGSRIGAPYALLLDPQGSELASLLPVAAEDRPAVLTTLLQRARIDGFALGVAAIDGEPVSFAIVPVFAPQLVAWVGMGVPLGAKQLEGFSAITALDAGLLLSDECRLSAAHGRLASGSIGATLCSELDRAVEAQRFATSSIGPWRRRSSPSDPSWTGNRCSPCACPNRRVRRSTCWSAARASRPCSRSCA